MIYYCTKCNALKLSNKVFSKYELFSISCSSCHFVINDICFYFYDDSFTDACQHLYLFSEFSHVIFSSGELSNVTLGGQFSKKIFYRQHITAEKVMSNVNIFHVFQGKNYN